MLQPWSSSEKEQCGCIIPDTDVSSNNLFVNLPDCSLRTYKMLNEKMNKNTITAIDMGPTNQIPWLDDDIAQVRGLNPRHSRRPIVLVPRLPHSSFIQKIALLVEVFALAKTNLTYFPVWDSDEIKTKQLNVFRYVYRGNVLERTTNFLTSTRTTIFLLVRFPISPAHHNLILFNFGARISCIFDHVILSIDFLCNDHSCFALFFSMWILCIMNFCLFAPLLSFRSWGSASTLSWAQLFECNLINSCKDQLRLDNVDNTAIFTYC